MFLTLNSDGQNGRLGKPKTLLIHYGLIICSQFGHEQTRLMSGNRLEGVVYHGTRPKVTADRLDLLFAFGGFLW